MTTPPAPPRTAERLLEALGAGPEFRDALLGDLAEDFATRAADDGERAARRWYWREALRVAPYLLHDWACRLRARDAARLAGLVGATCCLTFIGLWGVLSGVETVVERMTGPTTFPWHDPQPGTLSLGVMLLGYAAVGTVGGWMASRREERAPAAAALALGIAWAILALAVPVPGRAALPTWYLLGLVVAVLAGTMLGGLRRIATWRLPQART
ncbi:MAG: permease prefix domain 2-containing transporter [Longimicrobiaceae bacterium]